MADRPRIVSAATRIGRLYRGTSPYPNSAVGPAGRRLRHARSATYGELTHDGIARLIAATDLKAGDRFVDLGSGAGKAVLSVAMQVPGVTSLGIEIDAERFAIASMALGKAEAAGFVAPGRTRFVHADARGYDLSGGSVFYVCSTCFPRRLLNQLARNVAAVPGARVFASMQPLSSRVAARFAAQTTHRCPASWSSQTDIHLYWVRTPSP